MTSRANRNGFSIGILPTATTVIRRGDEIARLVFVDADSLRSADADA
jgi:hypothetical protein